MMTEEEELEIKKAAHEYSITKVQGVSILSALVAVCREVNFEDGAVWRLNNSQGDVKKEAQIYVNNNLKDLSPYGQKEGEIDFT